MRFQEDIMIVSTSEGNRTNYVHLRDRPIDSLIEILSESDFGFSGDISLIGYNSRRIPKDTLRIPLRLWREISSEKDVKPYSVFLTGGNGFLKKEHVFKLTLKDEIGVDPKDDRGFVNLINGSAVLTTDNRGEYSNALHVVKSVRDLVCSVYEK